MTQLFAIFLVTVAHLCTLEHWINEHLQLVW